VGGVEERLLLEEQGDPRAKNAAARLGGKATRRGERGKDYRRGQRYRRPLSLNDEEERR